MVLRYWKAPSWLSPYSTIRVRTARSMRANDVCATASSALASALSATRRITRRALATCRA
jgi:hypothetical protein